MSSSRDRLQSILNQNTERFPEDPSLFQYEKKNLWLATYRIPNFSDYEQLSQFLKRKEYPFSPISLFSPSSSILHLVMVLDLSYDDKSRVVSSEKDPGFDWFLSTALVAHVYLNIKDEWVLSESPMRVPLWLTYDWRFMNEEATHRILQSLKTGDEEQKEKQN